MKALMIEFAAKAMNKAEADMVTIKSIGDHPKFGEVFSINNSHEMFTLEALMTAGASTGKGLIFA